MVKLGLDSLVKRGLDSISKTRTGLYYTARNLTGLSQAVDFTGLRQVVNNATGLLVSSGCNRLAGTGLSQAVDNRAVATC
jgi:hypothetical protein